MLPEVEYFSDDKLEESLQWLFPDGFDPAQACDQCILTVTNDSVDKWNQAVQDMNPNEAKVLRSHDTFADVDDPKGFLQRNLTTMVLNDLNNPGSVPPHELRLKVCLC
jgi:hypothetical protein